MNHLPAIIPNKIKNKFFACIQDNLGVFYGLFLLKCEKKMFVIDTLMLHPGKNHFNFDLNPADFRLDIDDFNLIRPIHIDLIIDKIEDELIFQGCYETKGLFQCSRCLAMIEKPIEDAFEMFFQRQRRKNYENISDLTAKETQEYFYSGSKIDFAIHLREMLVVIVPMKILCRKDCKGLCPQCGQDLNEVECSCTQHTIDPRWEKLRKLKN